MINKFLAKSNGLSLVEHTQDVIAAAEGLIARLNLTDADRRYWLDKIVLCAKLHDVGKIHELFQENLILNTSKNSIRHEIMSLWLIEQFFNLTEDECFAIATHHKGVVQDGEFGRLTETTLQAESPILINNFYDFDLLRQFATEWSISFGLADKLKLADSTKPTFCRENLINLYADYQLNLKSVDHRFQFAKTRGLLIASDHIGSAQLQNELPNWKKLKTGMFHPRDKQTGRFLPFRSFQKNLQWIKNDVLLYAPTGSGKTEAALGWYFANQEQNGRLFYLLPYTASINAMVTRLQKVFNEKNPAKPKTVTALHSKTLEFFFEELEKEESNNQKNQDRARTMQSFSKELFFPVKVATPHQVLKNALMGKGWEMSLFDYQNACFIIDEFHTYDALMTGLMLTTVKWLKENFNAKIFFMSATIPLFLKELIIEKLYEGNQGIFVQPDLLKVTDRAILGKKRHKLICCRNESIIDKIPLILDFLSLGKSLLIIVNNVSTCQELYKDIDFSGDVKLLHSGFNKRDRIEIEKAITNTDSKPQLLIATQAVEVSLDIDYDIAFIENAPIDALIQRFGRVNRAGKQKRTAPVYIFENIIGNTAKFYDPEVLDATFQNLKKLDGQDLSEEDLVNVCNVVYENGYNQTQQADFDRGFNNSIINNFKEKLVAGHWRYWIEDVLEDNMKIEVLCENLVSEYLKLKAEGRYIEANQLLVSIYFYQTKKNNILDKSIRKKHQVTVAYDLKYDSDIGYVKIENESDIRFN